MKYQQTKQTVMLRLTQHLLRLPFVNSWRGRSRIKYGMTSLCNNGFTLIELLVVVFIIGVLSAVALPQYQKAVVRSEGMKMVSLLKTLSLSYAHYVLTNGTNPSVPSQLDISLPGWVKNTLWCRYGSQPSQGISNGKWTFQVNAWRYQGVMMGFASGPYTGCGFYIQQNQPGKIYCLEIVTGDKFQGNNGDCCEKVFKAKPVRKTSGVLTDLNNNFAIPFNWFLMPK